ncbi:hypothetical protein LOTGIDRAFT_157828 [Lottia gigantea]|uniref:DNA-directed RNA polymerase III subunit RPC3 n=1 Tax=Lottia gigantea TaxID=225164 RepID=V4B2G0_LOTGI|nr:hypothetical protein LOTGIDRAFT_157828 [Lottia gigantea]ESP00552.1 hypothetical protein LOTGIDRAFT_157828 [Lottia gigantea]
MSQSKILLASKLLHELYGEVVADIATHLMKFGPRHLKLISEKTKIKLEQVKKGIGILIQHNLIKFETSKKKPVMEYTVDCDRVILLSRYPKYIYCAKTLYGDAAELLVEELLQTGQSLMSESTERVTERLNEALESTGNPKITTSLVCDKFSLLVNTHFLRRCSNSVYDANERVIGYQEPLERDKLYILPNIEGSVKRKRLSEESTQSNKRLKTGSEYTVPDDGIYWMINVDRFHLYYRDQLIIDSVNNKIDQKSSEIIRSMLRLSEVKTEPMSTVSAPMTLAEILQSLPNELGMTKHILEQYLSILAEDSFLCQSHVESVVQERFGSKCLRIFRVLLLKRHLEQKQIEEYAMVPTKETKEMLYNMLAENYITITEVSKTVDHAPSRTFYIFRVQLEHVSRMVLDHCYKAAANAISRRQMEVNKHKRVLDKQERVDAIIASLEQSGADEAQKQEIRETITPPEAEQLEKCRNTVNMLESSELQIDETIFIIEMYLNYHLLHKAIK